MSEKHVPARNPPAASRPDGPQPLAPAAHAAPVTHAAAPAPTRAPAPAPASAHAPAPAPVSAPAPPSAPTAGPAPAPHASTRVLLRLWPYVRPVRARLATAAGVAITASSVSLVIPLVLKWIVDGPVAHHDPGGVWLGALYLLLLGLGEAGLFGLRRWLVARPLARVEAQMRGDLYRRLQRLPVAFHDRWPSGQLLSRATTDLMLLRQFLAFPLTFLLVNGATIVIGVVVLLVQQWTLGLVLLAPALPLMMLLGFFERRYSTAARRAQDQVGDLTTVVEEGVLGIRIIKGFGRHRSQAVAFRDLTHQLRGTELVKGKLLAWIWAVITTLPELAVGAALVLGTLEVADGDLSAGTLVAFLSTALALRWPIESIGFLLALTQESATATQRYFEVMDQAPETDLQEPELREPDLPELDVREPDLREPDLREPDLREPDLREPQASRPTAPAPGPAPQPQPQPQPVRTATVPGMVFDAVEFRYPDAPPTAPPVLRRIDLRIAPGETMALVGATGSGKTTLTALVPRLHEPTGGRITLDGEDITAISRERLRTLVAVAFEDPTLFSATVAENVLMGAPGTAGEAELRRALAVAQASFVHALPQGSATEVGEQGLSLSGGQRQRLALARAVVGRPRFLVLDDPLSALDVHTETLVEAALREVLADTTALIVAHRPSTVLLADRVALLAEGRIAAVGTHQELLRHNAAYAWLMASQERPAAARPPAAPERPTTGEPPVPTEPTEPPAPTEGSTP